MSIPIIQIAEQGLLKNLNTNEPCVYRGQVYTIMRKMKRNELTKEDIEAWNEAVEYLHRLIPKKR